MSHEFESGFVVRNPAWHGLADVLDEHVSSWDEARELAGLDWDVVEVPVYGKYRPNTDHPYYKEIDGYKMIVRSDNGNVLNIANDTYTPFSNADIGPLVEAIADQPDVRYETVGSLKEGRVVWAQLRLTEPLQIAGDNSPIHTFASVVNSHDGSMALAAQSGNVRIVCMNTVKAAERESQTKNTRFTFRHTGTINDRVEEAKRVVRGMKSEREDYEEWAKNLLGIHVTEEQRELFITEFIPEPTAAVVSDRVMANIQDARNTVRGYLNSRTCEGINHTAYGLVQAGIEYLDHGRGYQSQETHFTRSYLKREPLKRKMEKIAREVALA